MKTYGSTLIVVPSVSSPNLRSAVLSESSENDLASSSDSRSSPPTTPSKWSVNALTDAAASVVTPHATSTIGTAACTTSGSRRSRMYISCAKRWLHSGAGGEGVLGAQSAAPAVSAAGAGDVGWCGADRARCMASSTCESASDMHAAMRKETMPKPGTT